MTTAVSTQVAEVPFAQVERMAQAVAKSGMFAVKTPEGALTLMLIAQAEGIHPAQAMMDYDLIQNKPALKTASMLARFQRSGGKVRWIQSTDDVAEAEFSHPSGGSLVVRWDHARLVKAGLADRDMHKKFPAQMKRARCIGEGVRAIAPQCIPAGLYAVEEVQDMEEPVNVTPPAGDTATETVRKADVSGTALTDAEYDEHLAAISAAPDTTTLANAFASGWTHAKKANDMDSQAGLKLAYESRKADLARPAAEVM